MDRWKEFPGLEVVVRQVNGIDWSDLQDKQIPGGPFNFHVPKFVDDHFPGNANEIRSDHAATRLTVKGGPVQDSVADEVKVKVKDEIKEEDEVKIKHEPEDEPSVSVNIGPTERSPSSEPSTLDHEPHVPTHPYGSLYQKGFGDCPPGSPIHWMPQPSSLHQFGYLPTDWHGPPNPYCLPHFPSFYPFIPYYNFDFANSGSDGKIGPLDTQFPNNPQLRVNPERLSVSVPPPPGISPSAFLPPPLFPPPSLPLKNPNLPSKPSPVSSLPNAPPTRDMAAKQLDDKLGGKRNLSNSLGSSSYRGRPLKRRMLAQGGNISEANDPQYNRPGPGSGLPDFGTWFQGQVADSKKKLSHIERSCTPNDNRKNA